MTADSQSRARARPPSCSRSAMVWQAEGQVSCRAWVLTRGRVIPESQHRVSKHCSSYAACWSTGPESGTCGGAASPSLRPRSRHDGWRWCARSPPPCPWDGFTASRFVSLHAKYGLEDMFSSDLTNAELQDRLQHMSTAGQRCLTGTQGNPGLRTLMSISMDDEYVPCDVDMKLLGSRLVSAMDLIGSGDVTSVHIADANHSLRHPSSASSKFIEEVCSLLESESIPHIDDSADSDSDL